MVIAETYRHGASFVFFFLHISNFNVQINHSINL